MVNKKFDLFLSVIFLLIVVAVSGSVSADFTGCWEHSGTNNATCVESGGSGCHWKTQAEDPWCDYTGGCCMDIGCWTYDGTNQSYCEDDNPLAATMNCTWDPFFTMWYPNGTQSTTSGGCMMDWSGGGGNWGGVAEGCWQYDGDKASCGAQGGTCQWKANDANQEPWCGIKSLTDAQGKNSDATSTDIGCCETSGCWTHDGNETSCIGAFLGNCVYENSSYGGGWCMTKACEEIITESNCTYAKQTLFMPCDWNVSGTGLCEGFSGGGMTFYNNNSDSCFDNGGWYNSTGGCEMPSGGSGFGGGGGGFMFAGDAHCWFADNQPTTCGNITGCAYCVAGTGINGTENTSSNNICSRKQVGYCEGHVYGDPTYTNANNTENLACTDIKIKSACNFGPLPNCKWTNSTNNTGAYCESGVKTEKISPPVQYCEDPTSKNNYTLCLQLQQEYMMPCKWENATYPIKNCTFNKNAVFGGGGGDGSGGGEVDFEVIGSQFSCTSAGGTWQTEYYVDNDVLKQDSWCEMTGLFDIDGGGGEGNKGNCDTNCWACEFQSNGTAWPDVTAIEAACVGSALGYCSWTNDSSGTASFNGFGWCDYPTEMEDGGAKDCNLECEGCNFANDPYDACLSSMANNGSGCKWSNNDSSGDTGYCVDTTKKICFTDCQSCYDETSCYSSNISCGWDTTFNICTKQGDDKEICFDGIDNNNDGLVDCAEPYCMGDNFCGGGSFGGDCFAQTTEGTCNQTEAFSGLNCTWMNDTWNPNGWCDMPGMNCWQFDSDLVACGATPGCTNETTLMGGSLFCEMNWTKMNNANCFSASDESSCEALPGDCTWQNDTWCAANPEDSWCASNPNAGWCDYSPMSVCMSMDTENTCNANANCSWKTDSFNNFEGNNGGWCDIACFNQDLNTEESCENATFNGLCELRNMSETCQPSTFMMFGSDGTGGKTGCWQYDGNETACTQNNVTCTYKNDTWANNNLSETEPAGWCMDKTEYQHFGEVDGDVIDLAMDSDNVMGASETGVNDEIDIMGMGMRVTDEGFNFGAGIVNISDSAICNGFMVGNPVDPFSSKTLGSGNQTSKFYWYLDTDGNDSNGCAAVPVSGANLTGYDFMISYTSENTTSGITETKQLKRCSSNTWSPTNALVSTSKKMSCGEIGGVMIAIAKQDIESFAEYNKTTTMKIFMTSANSTDSRTSPTDNVGPGYYTPGTIDFGFVDCSDPNMATDPKCKNFKKFGFNVYEECKNGVDDDENGLVDCNDPFCTWIPDCAGSNAFNFVADISDNTAPVVMFSDVEKLRDAAFIKIDTNEPSNMSLQFYLNESTCQTINTTLTDTGTGYQANANFKPFHSIDLITDTLGYALTNNTAYYYKVKVCDPSGNCALSACTNFTTKATNVDKTFIFKVELPAGYTVDIPALNKTGYNFTENFGGTNYDVGIKTNTSVTKNMNMTLHCGDMAIGLYGMNVLSPTKIDLTNAFVCDETNDYIGMNSSLKKWNKLVDDLHLGGASDYVEVTLPVAYDAANTLSWGNDAGASGQDVDDYVECADGGSSNTACKVPVSMGFSTYTITTPTAAAAATTSSGGGGGGAATNDTNETATVDTGSITGDVTAPAEDETTEDKGGLGETVSNIVDSVKSSWVWLIIVLIVLVIVVAGIVYYKKRF